MKATKNDKVTAAVSIGKTVMVRGYEIKRLPLGKYLELTEMLRTLPETLMKACFPGMTAVEILAMLKNVDAAMLSDMVVRCTLAAPREAMRILAFCTGIDEQTLLEDEEIGLDGAAEMVEACWELNKIGNFTQAAARLVAKAKESTTRTDGSKG